MAIPYGCCSCFFGLGPLNEIEKMNKAIAASVYATVQHQILNRVTLDVGF